MVRRPSTGRLHRTPAASNVLPNTVVVLLSHPMSFTSCSLARSNSLFSLSAAYRALASELCRSSSSRCLSSSRCYRSSAVYCVCISMRRRSDSISRCTSMQCCFPLQLVGHTLPRSVVYLPFAASIPLPAASALPSHTRTPISADLKRVQVAI